MTKQKSERNEKIFIVSLGCDKNLVDTEFMIGALESAGYKFTNDEREADVIIINTCCFINDAKEESINTILEMAEYKDAGSCKSLIVTGCLAERYREEIIREIPQVDALLGTNSYKEIVHALDEALEGNQYELYESMEGQQHIFGQRIITTGGHYAHLKIAEGCNKNCTYCVIPKIRGPYRSVPMEELLEHARELAERGVKELILVAQETTLYGVDLYGEKSLHKLLDELNKIPGIYWIRIMYCYPEEIYEELIQSIKRNKKVCHYLDMPIQHINNEILRRMGRRTTKEELTKRIAHLREEIPDIILRTTIISGFPGETQEMHEELMYFLNDMEFDRLGVFNYSREEGTAAAEFPNQIDEELKGKWHDEIMELQEEIIFDKNEQLNGKDICVMIEGKIDDDTFDEEIEEGDIYVGRTYRDAPEIDGYIFVNTSEQLMSGDFIEVEVIETYGYDVLSTVKNR